MHKSSKDGLVIAHFGSTLLVEDQFGKLHKCYARKNLGSLVTGDNVTWQRVDEQNGVIVELNSRRSLLKRTISANNSKPMAANVDQMLIVIAPKPKISQTTIDRYLVQANINGLQALIIMNKIDLIKPRQTHKFESLLNEYEKIGYNHLLVSCKQDTEISHLTEYLQNKTNIVVGQSGVGKSSLIQKLVPDLQVSIGELSNIDSGKHTTSASRLYHLPNGGHIIDSPGIRELKLHYLTADELVQGFIEFQPYLGKCKFRNCTHRHEPDCAILEATKAGKIAEFRLKNYYTMLDEI